MYCPIWWLSECAIAQGGVQAAPIAPPQTGNAGLDALFYLIYLGIGVGGLSLVDKVLFWITKYRGRRNGGGDGEGLTRLARATERLAEGMERLDARLDHIHDICTRLEDRSRHYGRSGT